jgi:hypothetical protein
MHAVFHVLVFHVYKFQTGMIKHLWSFERKNCERAMRTLIKVGASLLILSLWVMVGAIALPENPAILAKQPPASAPAAGDDFTFSVFFTGNELGNLEPCG